MVIRTRDAPTARTGRREVPQVSMPVAVLATVIPFLVPVIDELLRLSTGQVRGARPLPCPPLGKWLRFYRNTRRLSGTMQEALGLDLAGWSGRAEAVDVGPAAEVPLRLRPLKELAAAALRPSSVEQPEATLRALLRTPEALFMATVWLPCVMLYGAPPSRLVRRARQGDRAALEALVRVDKSVVFEARLQQRWHEATRDAKRSRVDGVLAAMAGRPHRRFTRSKIRVALAKVLGDLLERDGVRLGSTKLRKVFAEMTPSGALSDAEMPGGWVLTKALQRARKRDGERTARSRKVDNKS